MFIGLKISNSTFIIIGSQGLLLLAASIHILIASYFLRRHFPSWALAKLALQVSNGD
jgi:uncharacterized membrane protein